MGKKRAKTPRTESFLFLKQLTVIVAKRLKEEKWSKEDAQMTKKLTKKEKQRQQQRRNEELKYAVEAERIRLIEEEKKRQEQERKDAIEKEARDNVEHGVRSEQLKASCTHIRKLQQHWLKQETKTVQEAEWEQSLKCDGLPDPSNCGEMNTYLHLWDKIKENTLEDLAIQKTNEVFQLLDTLDHFLDSPAVPETKKQDWMTIRNSFREYQQYNLDCLAYRLLRDIPHRLDRLNIPTARKLIVHPKELFTLCVWALVQLPIPAENPKRPKKPPTHFYFEDVMDLDVSFPKEIDVWARCLRVMYLKYDHFSHRCDSYAAPPIPEGLRINLCQVAINEWEAKVKTKEIEREKVRAERELIANELMAQAQLSRKEVDLQAAKDAVKKKNEFVKVEASAIYITQEDAQYAEYRNQMITEVPEGVINLRKFRILGGIFFVDLFFQPPQPTTMVLSEITMSTLSLPKFLDPVPFYYQFSPPPPTEPGVVRQPEEIEAEIKKVEIEYEQMLHISLQLPTNALWIDPPILCQWDEDLTAWTTKDVHDYKYNEEKQTVQFKTGRFAAFSFAANRYNNLPFQAWELKPAPGNRVILTIMAAVLILEFTVCGPLISLTQLQNAPSASLDFLIGQWLPLPRLRRLLRRGGVEVFPAHDVFLYVEGTCEKQWPMEQHLYFQMAQCSLYYTFAWSRWNVTAGRRNIVLQVKESSSTERSKQPSYSMLMVNPLKALFIDCTEVSQVFNDEGVKNMKFYSDFYHLLIGTTPIRMKCKIERTPVDLINTVAQLLIATRVLSLS